MAGTGRAVNALVGGLMQGYSFGEQIRARRAAEAAAADEKRYQRSRDVIEDQRAERKYGLELADSQRQAEKDKREAAKALTPEQQAKANEAAVAEAEAKVGLTKAQTAKASQPDKPRAPTRTEELDRYIREFGMKEGTERFNIAYPTRGVGAGGKGPALSPNEVMGQAGSASARAFARLKLDMEQDDDLAKDAARQRKLLDQYGAEELNSVGLTLEMVEQISGKKGAEALRAAAAAAPTSQGNQLSNQIINQALGSAAPAAPLKSAANPAATPTPAPSTQYQEGATARNPKTGERIVFRGGKWEPIQ